MNVNIQSCLTPLIPSDSVRPVSTTVCELAANQATYDKKLVRVSGVVESDGMEYENLIDVQCPHVGTDLGLSEAIRKKKTVAKLQTAIYKANPIGTKSLKITATVLGIFRASNGHDPRSIAVESIENLKIEHWDSRQTKPWMDFGPPPD